MIRQAAIVACVLAVCVHANKVNDWTGTNLVRGTATTAECEGDVFPSKVTEKFAGFEIEYKGNYKILTNTNAQPPKKYVLWQRGCTKPMTETGVDEYFEVPLTSVYSGSSTINNLIEYIGERKALRAVNGMYTSSPCLQKQNTDGWTVDASAAAWVADTEAWCKWDWSGGDDGWGGCVGEFAEMDNAAIEGSFIWGGYGPPGLTSGLIEMSDTMEDTFLKISAWNKFVAAFFNREDEIMTFTDKMRERWVCHSAATDSVTTKKKAVYLDKLYQDWGPGSPEGYIVNSCAPGKAAYRWCELMTAAAAEPLNADTSYLTETLDAGYELDAQGKIMGVSAAHVKEWVKDADVIIFANTWCPSFPDADDEVAACEEHYDGLLSELSGIKAVDNNQMYDIGREHNPLGGTDFLEGAHLEPDVILEDTIKIIYPDVRPEHNLVWLRNMATEGHGSNHECEFHPNRPGCKPSAAQLSAMCTAHLDHQLVNDGCPIDGGGDDSAASPHKGSMLMVAAASVVAMMLAMFH